MNILAFTDLHGRINLLDTLKKKSKECDIIVCCGDLTNFENEMSMLIRTIAGFGKPVLMINGNHEDDVNMERACSQFKNVQFIHKSFYKTGKYIFFGFGGGGFSKREPEFEKISKEFKKHIEKGKKVILLTHGPSYGTLLDIIGDDHVGVISYKEFIDNNAVHLHICGHLHENQKVVQKYREKTIIINPGPDGMIIEI